MPSVCAVNCRFPLPFRPGHGARLPRPNRRKGSLKRDAFNPADASAITDESRLALPRARLPQTGRVYPCRSLGGSKREPSSPADASAIVPAVEQAKADGAVVIGISDTIDSDDLQFTVAMDHVTIGEQSAQGIVDFLTEKYGEPQGKVVEMQGIAGSAAGADRTTGFHNVIDKYPNIEVVAEADGGFDTDKTFQAMSTILQAHPDIDAVMNANDSEAQGSTKAIEAAGLFAPVGDPKHIFVTGNDAPAPAIADIRANRQDMTVASNPIKLSELVMDKIAELEAGKDVQGFIEWPGQIITPANIDSDEVKEYGIWADEVG